MSDNTKLDRLRRAREETILKHDSLADRGWKRKPDGLDSVVSPYDGSIHSFSDAVDIERGRDQTELIAAIDELLAEGKEHG